ncbi:hypothetical protein DUI87_10407 [Hirundo rustica rustica]|uniref:Uncharacterized protein n=1 Tax=Hirundo rustica rustica TaxID=333673 RepID=A0A3M0KI25_HIRRU|nr:hypothetical protein DUI87_10407 [Hirundo rustica rustica]
MEVMKSGSSFQVWFMRRTYNEDQGHCYTRGKATSTRKSTARETSLHRTYGASVLIMMHETSGTAASNGLDNFLAYQWFTLGGSKKGSKDSTFYGCCRSLQSSRMMTRFYHKALVSLALKFIFARDNKLHGEGSQETAA